MKGDFDNTSETEKSVLSSILEGQVSFEEVKAVLESNDFNTETHRLIFKAMESLTRRCEPIGFITLGDELNKVPMPNGGVWISYLTNLSLTALPIVNNTHLNFHLTKIKRASRGRQLWKLSLQMAKAIKDGDETEAERLRGEIADFKYTETEEDIISLASHTPEHLNWLLESAIPNGFPTMIYGEGGIGKSYLALLIATQAAMGDQVFLGLRFAEKAQNVLYVDYELDKDELTRRAQKVSKGLGLDKVPDNLFYFSPGESLPRTITKLRYNIRSKAIGFVVIDSLGASAVDGEHVPDVVSLFSEIRKLGVATLILDHQAKLQVGDKYSKKTPYGSVYKYNLTRSVFQLSFVCSEGNRITLKLHHTKSNFARPINDLIFDVAFEGDRVLFTKSTRQNPEVQEIELIIKAMYELYGDGKKVNQKALIEQLKGKIAKNRVIYLLNKYEDDFWLISSGDRTEKLYEPKNPECENGLEDMGIPEVITAGNY